jgi:hypothetical protein
MAGSLKPKEKNNKFHFGYIILIVSVIIIAVALGYAAFEKTNLKNV